MQNYFWFLKDVDDDVVTLGVKALCIMMSLCTILWLISFVLVMIQIIEIDLYFSVNALLFLPMWIGTAIATATNCYVSISVCRNATLVTRERRSYMRALQIESDLEFIDYESLPLCRKLFCLSITIGVSTLVVLFAQVLFYLWFVGVIKDIWNALVPIMTLLILYQIYMYLMKFFSLRSCSLFSLLLIQLVVFTAKANHEISVLWSVVAIPIILALVIFATLLVSILVKTGSRKYHLTALQWLGFTGYALSWCLSVTAVYKLTTPDDNSTATISRTIPFLWTVSICLFTLSALLMLNIEGWRLSATRGYDAPIPLELTGEGWMIANAAGAQRGERWEDTLLLGRVNLGRSTLSKGAQSQSYLQLLNSTSKTATSGGSSEKITATSQGIVRINDTQDVMRMKLDVMEPLAWEEEKEVYLRDSYQSSEPSNTHEVGNEV